MKRVLVTLTILCFYSGASITPPALAGAQEIQEAAREVTFFDVLDLPARIDQPKLLKQKKESVLQCALANRSGKQIVGLRLTLMVVESSGKVRSLNTWNEAAAVKAYSIRTFEFHPIIKDEINKSADLFLGVDEVIGSDTIWRTVDSDKLLRAYARGQHDLIPKVQRLVNTVDERSAPRIIPLSMKKP
jgi:hypothetical protein